MQRKACSCLSFHSATRSSMYHCTSQVTLLLWFCGRGRQGARGGDNTTVTAQACCFECKQQKAYPQQCSCILAAFLALPAISFALLLAATSICLSDKQLRRSRQLKSHAAHMCNAVKVMYIGRLALTAVLGERKPRTDAMEIRPNSLRTAAEGRGGMKGFKQSII